MTIEEKVSITDRKGYLRVFGGDSLTSLYHQSIVALKSKDFKFKIGTALDFNPKSDQELAGMICYYNTKN